jgi:hypothetical protein
MAAPQARRRLRDAVLPTLPSQADAQLRNRFTRLCNRLDAAQRLVPQLPNDAFDNRPLYDLLVKAFGPPSASAQHEAFQPALYDPWNCMVGHLGFWGAAAAVTFVALCVACLAWIITSGLPLIWPIIWEALQMFGLPFGVLYVATVIVSCLLGFTPP